MEQLKPRTDYQLKMDILADKVMSVVTDYIYVANKGGVDKDTTDSIYSKMEDLFSQMKKAVPPPTLPS